MRISSKESMVSLLSCMKDFKKDDLDILSLIKKGHVVEKELVGDCIYLGHVF